MTKGKIEILEIIEVKRMRICGEDLYYHFFIEVEIVIFIFSYSVIQVFF